jgi:hypothetical protein
MVAHAISSAPPNPLAQIGYPVHEPRIDVRTRGGDGAYSRLDRGREPPSTWRCQATCGDSDGNQGRFHGAFDGHECC